MRAHLGAATRARRAPWGGRCAAQLPLAIAALALLCAARAPSPAEAPDDPGAVDAPDRVEIEPRARDHEIRQRLSEILAATGWFSDTKIRVQDGVVFLEGRAQSEQYKKWAGDLARNTRDVAVVVNRMDIIEPPIWDFRPALAGLRDLARGVVRALPLMAFAAAVLLFSALVARSSTRFARWVLRNRPLTPFLQDVLARTAGTAIFILGLYIVLRVAGLTTIALTVMGGTGLLGLIVGIAFRGITENFLASVFLSIQKPFRAGDLVEIAEYLGYVQRLTNRATVLMTLDGNHVQIPNSTVYQTAIRNYTSNPDRRDDFCIGVGYEDNVSFAQQVALSVLERHPAVLAEPKPWVLVDSLGKATVNLRVYYWLDGSKHSWLKVRSSVIRLIKRGFQEAGISLPDEAREVIFPEGLPVKIVESVRPGEVAPKPAAVSVPEREAASESAAAETGLYSDADTIEAQARKARVPEEGQDLLQPAPPPPDSPP